MTATMAMPMVREMTLMKITPPTATLIMMATRNDFALMIGMTCGEDTGCNRGAIGNGGHNNNDNATCTSKAF